MARGPQNAQTAPIGTHVLEKSALRSSPGWRRSSEQTVLLLYPNVWRMWPQEARRKETFPTLHTLGQVLSLTPLAVCLAVPKVKTERPRASRSHQTPL